MDAVEFIKERQRLCQTYAHCFKCPAYNNNTEGCNFNTAFGYEAIEQIRLLEEWSAAHPLRTRQDLFLEQYPKAKLFIDGILDFCPLDIDKDYQCKSTDIEMRCQSCRREFWSQEVK